MYQALYRKWRPKTFAEVVGQESVTVTLANEVRDGRISHAYLFTGTRGTGKTTCAKIFAKAVNCLNPKNGNPCNACAMCTGIDSGSVMDVVELDAASNNGVDDIRSLIDETGFTPAQASYRVYIIDEVHMLSASASNAFLKTLEEPPEHVIFILATTDAHKLLPTIRSRCQRFDFKRIYAEDIVDRLLFVAGEESIDLDRDAAVLLARLADGALRDALSILDLCATGETRVTVEVVRRVTGLADKHYLFDLADCVHTGDIGRALTILGDLHSDSCDMDLLCAEFMNHLRSLMIIKTLRPASAVDALLICTDDDFARLKIQADNCSLEDILYRLQLLAETAARLSQGVNKRVETEVAFVKLCDASLSDSSSALKKRVADLEAALSNGDRLPVTPSVTPKIPEPLPPKEDLPAPAPVKEEEKFPVKYCLPTPPVKDPVAPAEEDEAPGEEPRGEEPPDKQPPDEEPPTENPPAAKPQSVLSEEPAAVSEDPVVFAAWPEVVEAVKSMSVRLWSFLNATTAFVQEDTLFIKGQDAALKLLLESPEKAEVLLNALKAVAGRRYAIKLYKRPTGGSSEQGSFLQNIKKITIDDDETF